MEENKNIKEIKKYLLKSIDFRHEPLLPVFSEPITRTAWVNYGENNLMPNYLISRYNNCAIHKAIVNSKREQVTGDGLICLNNPMSVVSLVNGKENINEIYRKCALDLILFGGYALNVILSRDRKSIAEIYHIDFSKVRSGKMNEDEEVEMYYYSLDWNNVRRFPPQEYPAFNMNTKEPSQILYYKDYSPNLMYYPQPDYSGGLASIEIDVNIKQFHANNLKNGMSPSLWINMNNGIPSEDEQRIIARGLEEQYSSVNNAGRPIVSFNESAELAPDITQIPQNGNDGYYSAIYDDILRSILSAHRVTSGELFGISTAGKLGARQEIVDSSEYFYKTVIRPYQNQMLPTFEKVLSLKTEQPTNLEVKPLKIFDDEINEEDLDKTD